MADSLELTEEGLEQCLDDFVEARKETPATMRDLVLALLSVSKVMLVCTRALRDTLNTHRYMEEG